MLTAETIVNNWNELLSIIQTYIASPRREKLLKFYTDFEDRISIMPASHKIQYHNCFPGGYVDHVIRVTKGALKLDEVWKSMGVTVNYTVEELVFSAINHDLGKMGTLENPAYIEQTDQWRRDKLNETYQYNNKIEFMSVPDRSLFLLNSQDIKVTKNELLAIKLHDGMYDEANKPYLLGWLPEQKVRTSLVHILHHADMMAARIEFEKEWLPKFEETKTKPDTKLDSTKLDSTLRKVQVPKDRIKSNLSKLLDNI